MRLTENHTIVIGCSILALTIASAAYFQLYLLLGLPVAIFSVLLLLQYPQYILYALMLTIPWSVEFNFTPSLGTDLPDEPLMLLGALAAVLMFLFNFRNISTDKLNHPLILIVFLQMVWVLLTLLTSTEKLLSLKYLLAKSWYLLAFIALPLFIIKDERMIRRLGALLAFSMLAFMVFALIRHQQYDFTFEMINTALEPFYRNHVNYSALLVFTVPIQIAAIQFTKSRNTRLFLIVVLLVSLAALYFSYARGAWLALVVGTAGYWLIRKRLLVLSFVLGIIFSIGAVAWLQANDNYLKYSHDFKTTVFHTNFREHLAATYQFKDASTAERFYRWIAGVRMAADKWETGFGPSSFYRQYRPYTIPAFKTWVSDNPEQSTVHNYFLLQFLEQGLVGFLLFVVLVAFMFWNAQKIYHRTTSRFWKIVVAALTSILLMECVVNFLSDLIEADKAGPIFYLCLSLLVIADIRTRKENKVSHLHNL